MFPHVKHLPPIFGVDVFMKIFLPKSYSFSVPSYEECNSYNTVLETNVVCGK